MEAIGSSETSVLKRTTQHCLIPEESILHSYHHEYMKSLHPLFKTIISGPCLGSQFINIIMFQKLIIFQISVEEDATENRLLGLFIELFSNNGHIYKSSYAKIHGLREFLLKYSRKHVSFQTLFT
jgi:hypothetical protein